MINTTLILPVRDGEYFIRDAINNLLSIAGITDEILIIDDNSTDQTPVIIKNYMKTDNRIRYIRNPNHGLVNALNLGLEESSNEWIARCDVDDVYADNRIQIQKSFISEKVSAIFSDYKFISVNSINLGTMPSAVHSQAVSVSLSKSQRTAHPSVMYRKTAVKAAGGYKSNDFPVEDLSLWLRMSRDGNLVSVPEVLLMYRMSKGSISDTKRKTIQTKTKEILSLYGINRADYLYVKENLESVFQSYGEFSMPERRKLLLLREMFIINSKPNKFGLSNQNDQFFLKNIKHVLGKNFLIELVMLKKEKNSRDRIRMNSNE